ncbi:ParB/RepB/Spo0J family partition protein [Candidatus Campbellbacteria bacterium]|nr:MAG: ParB/RepB/Spo0J family partition protein [Candidatus Campbellbacteria bacterium]
MSFHNNAIFWVEVEKIVPNPFQPRRFFDEQKLKDLSDSIRQYGVLQPLVVTRREQQREDGGLSVQYELIAGERRLRASKMAGVSLVPVIIRDDEESEQMKLELAIIENLQREDINPIERARAFAQLAEQFGLKHGDIARKVGRSREYVSNTIRLLLLSEEMQQALSEGKINEGHTRPLLMLIDRPEEQTVLFKEIIFKKLTVRDAEQISRRIAVEKVRRHDRLYDPDIVELETRASERLGTRVRVEPKEVGGRIFIDFVSEEDLRKILAVLNNEEVRHEQPVDVVVSVEQVDVPVAGSAEVVPSAPVSEEVPKKEDDDLYSVTNFSL